MEKLLVTGATGFIGNYVIAELLQQNYLVIASSSNIENAKHADWYPFVKYIPFNLHEFDDKIDYAAYFGHPDAIIHLAWEGLPNYKAAFHLEENLPRHYSFIRNLVLNGLTDITITGTCFEYGMQEGCLSENMETHPVNSYAIAKDTLRKQLEELQLQTNFTLRWVRLFYMYGKGQNPNSLLSQLDIALVNGEKEFNMSEGEQERDYLHVEKVAKYLEKISSQKEVTGVINCCSGIPIKVKEFVIYYLSQNKKHIQLNLGYYPYAEYEAMHFWGDNKKLNLIISK